MKEFDERAVTLAIGDGGNDVSMIMEANIGVGIYGEEGLSAAQAGDFAIGEFKLLKRLLFIHGRTNLYRISKMILYFFYKNFIFTLTQFYFSFLCLASGQTIVDDWYITCYNLVFTALPLCVRAVTDSDINLNDKKITKKNLALLYKENRDSYKPFTFLRLIGNLAKGMIISFFVYILIQTGELLGRGYNKNLWYLSLKSYICIIIIVSMNLLINSYFISYILPLSIGITTFCLFFIFLVLNHYGFLFNFNSKATIETSLSSPQIYMTILLISCCNFVYDYTEKLISIYFINSLSSKLLLNKNTKKRKRSYSNMSKVNISKISKSKIIESNIEHEKSNNYLITRNSSNKLNILTPNKKNYLNLNYIPKISRFQEHATYKNDFYSLNILKNISNKNNNIVNNDNNNNNK
jgi:magnesium-transporting ATPase (P-type)